MFPKMVLGETHLEFVSATPFLVRQLRAQPPLAKLLSQPHTDCPAHPWQAESEGGPPDVTSGLTPAFFFTASFGNCTDAEFANAGRRAIYIKGIKRILPGERARLGHGGQSQLAGGISSGLYFAAVQEPTSPPW